VEKWRGTKKACNTVVNLWEGGRVSKTFSRERGGGVQGGGKGNFREKERGSFAKGGVRGGGVT